MRAIIPILRHHKTCQSAYARFDGKRIYFGPWPKNARRPPAMTIRAYEKHVVSWIQRRHQGLPAKPPTVAQVVIAYLKAHPGTQEEFRETCTLFAKVLGHELADDVSAFKLKSVQQAMVAEGWTRQRINRQVQKIVELIRWSVSEDMVVLGAWTSAKILSSLKYGRTSAPEERKSGTNCQD